MTSTTGGDAAPGVSGLPRLAALRTPRSTAGTRSFGTDPPRVSSTNAMPLPRSPGATSIVTPANCPGPPPCFLWRYETVTGLPIVDTMVSVNVVYIASVGVSLVVLLRGGPTALPDETWVIGAGFLGSVAAYLFAWVAGSPSGAELTALATGLVAATLVRLALGRRHRREFVCGPLDR